jgi:hypothetical protein
MNFPMMVGTEENALIQLGPDGLEGGYTVGDVEFLI